MFKLRQFSTYVKAYLYIADLYGCMTAPVSLLLASLPHLDPGSAGRSVRSVVLRGGPSKLHIP